MDSTKGFSHLLSVDEVAAVLGTGRRFIYRLTHERRIRFMRLGRELRFHPDDVQAYIENCVVEPTDPPSASVARVVPTRGRPRRV